MSGGMDEFTMQDVTRNTNKENEMNDLSINTWDYVTIKSTGKVGRATSYSSAFAEDSFLVNDVWYASYELELFRRNDRVEHKLEVEP